MNERMREDGFEPIPFGAKTWAIPLLKYIDWLRTNHNQRY
jgi:hypothetical protein